jgi:hypothetical protein
MQKSTQNKNCIIIATPAKIIRTQNSIMKAFLISFALISGLLTCPSMTNAQRVNINPTLLSFNAAAGESSSQTITIVNISNEKQVFQLTLGDWLRDSLGNHQYLKAGTLSRSCANWIKLDNSFIEIEPRASKEIRVTLSAPTDTLMLKEMKWAMLFVQNVKEQENSKKKKGKVNAIINEIFRFGIHLYQTPPGIHNFEAKAIDLRPDESIKGSYNFFVRNTGNVMLQCQARLELTNMETGEEIKLERIEFPIFPDANRTIPLAIPGNLKKGRYSVLAMLEYHDDMPLEAIEMTIEIK